MHNLLLAAGSGLLLALALPPHDVEWLAWFAVAPLLVAARGRRPLEAVGLGLWSGLVAGLLQVGWHPNLHLLHLAYLPYLWLGLLLATAAAAAAWLDRRSSPKRVATPPLLAAIAVAAEWLTTFLPLPIQLALCQFRTLAVIQIADLTGAWGVSFLLWWWNAAISQAASCPRRQWPALAAPAFVLALALSYGVIATRAPARAGSLRVAAIQEFNGAETTPLGIPEPPAGAPDREALTREAVQRGARLVVWSEGCLGSAFAPGQPDDPSARLARELGSWLVVGYTESARPKDFNCAALIGPDGTARGPHRKIHLFLGERQTVQPGREARTFGTPVGRFGMEICFDSCSPGLTRRLAAGGAQLIAMPNYDPPVPRGMLHHLHAAILPFRAVENRVAFVRADPNGCSQLIDPCGRIVAQSPLFAADALVGELSLGTGTGTPYTRAGDWVAYLCVLFAAAAILDAAAFNKRKGRGGGPEELPRE